jgi:hypothetical protein
LAIHVIAEQYLEMLAKILRNRFARTLLFGGLGAVFGYGITRAGMLIGCYMVDHTLWEQLWAGWSVVIFTMAYAIIGAVYGSTPVQDG